jgi:4-diphosphocytidyl-2-C-methyl-D-erythritol kinase
VAIDKRLPPAAGGRRLVDRPALIAANHLWQAGLDRTELMALGLPLGADIPFFIYGQNAFAEGVGERLQPVATRDCWFLVIEPGVAVPTAAIFCSEDLTRDTKPVRIADFSSHLMIASDHKGFGQNDLQAVATGLFPPVAEAVEWLGSYGDARMTGSGACVFCAFQTEAAAEAVLAKMPSRWKAWKARSLQRHPMYALLQVERVIE